MKDSFLNTNASANSEVRFEPTRLFAARILEALNAGTPALLIRQFPLGASTEDAKSLMLEFCSSLGVPTATDPERGTIIWEVTPRKHLPSNHSPTITENAIFADLHTDSSYMPQPEQFVSFMMLHPAEDGGGETFYVDGEAAIKWLEQSAHGSATLRILRETKYLFRVPTSFTRLQSDLTPEWVEAPLLADVPLIRYRRDSLQEGFEAAPERFSDAEKLAAWAFGDALQSLPQERRYLERGDLLILNNHRLLHGRTAFSDLSRLMLRCRFNFS